MKELQLTDNPSFDFKAVDGPSVGDGYVDRLVSSQLVEYHCYLVNTEGPFAVVEGQ